MTSTHLLVFAELVRAAQYQGVTTYQDIAALLGMPAQGRHLPDTIGTILGVLSRHEVEQGRPMLSSVVVNADGMPGDGFFRLAAELGRSGDDRRALELAETYKTWKRPLPKT